MDFPAEGVEIRTLVDIVTKRLGIPILYDETIAGKKIILRVPIPVPESALPGILQSALRMKGLALVDAEQPGWKQIVPAANLAAMARPTTNPTTNPTDNASAITLVVPLQRVEPARVMEAARGMLTTPGGNMQAVAGQKLLIVSDYAGVAQRIAELARLLDGEGTAIETKFVPMKEADATTVAQTVTQLLAAQGGGGTEGAVAGVQLTADERLNQIVAIAPANRMPQILELINGLDKPLELETKVYHLKTISGERID
jgi:type II secretory pathway component GspD/PulD (secretin)